MSVPTSPTRRGARRLVVATALALGLTAAAFASPARAEPTTTAPLSPARLAACSWLRRSGAVIASPVAEKSWA